MFNKEKEVNGSSKMKYRFVTKRDNDLEVILVRNVLLPSKIHVLNEDFKVTLLPWKKTAKLYVGDRKNDLAVEKVEIVGDSNIKLDLDVTFKISGEAYFDRYWAKKNAEKSASVDNRELLAELGTIKAKIAECKDGELSRRDYIKIKEILTILLNRDICDNELVGKIEVIRDLVSNKISNPAYRFDINEIDDVINDALIIFEQPINSNNQDEHRESIGFFGKIAEKRKWSYNHGATKFYSMAEHNYKAIEEFVVSEINTHIKTMCAKMDYDEVKSIKHVKESIVNEINENLVGYGIEITSIRVQRVDQSNAELDAAGDKVKVAQKEREATLIKAQAEADAILKKGQAEADVEAQKQYAAAKGLQAKVDVVEKTGLDSTAIAALTGGNVTAYNISGTENVINSIASRFGQPKAQTDETQNFREVAAQETTTGEANNSNNSLDDWTFEDEENTNTANTSGSASVEIPENAATVTGEEVVNNVATEEESNKKVEEEASASKTVNESNNITELEELIVRLERLSRIQFRVTQQMSEIKDKNSDEFTDLFNYLQDLQMEEKAVQKSFKK